MPTDCFITFSNKVSIFPTFRYIFIQLFLRYNLHTIRCTYFECVVLTNENTCVITPPIKIQSISITPGSSLLICLYCPLLLQMRRKWSDFCHHKPFASSKISCKWKHIICTPCVCLLSLNIMSVRLIPDSVCLLLVHLYFLVVFPWRNVSFFVYPFICWWTFELRLIWSKYFWGHLFSILVGKYLGVVLLGQRVCSSIILLKENKQIQTKKTNGILKWLWHFTLPPTKYVYFSYSTFNICYGQFFF